jgi:excinuclease UvrABC nuclease subunit
VITGIYQILNTVDGKIYIGKARDIKCRWRNHRYQLKKGMKQIA